MAHRVVNRLIVAAKYGLLAVLVGGMLSCSDDNDAGGAASEVLAGLAMRENGVPEGLSGDLYDVIWSDLVNGYIAVGTAMGSGDIVSSSPDGVTWRRTTVSTDGMTWQTQTITNTGALEAIGFMGAMFVAVGWNGTLMTSANGDNWTTHSTGMPENALRDIASNGKQIVVVGDSGAVLSSTDMSGTTWEDRTPSEGRVHFGGVVYANEAFVIASIYDDVVISTVSGDSYSMKPIESNGSIEGIAAHNGQIVVLGSGGAIFSTPPR